MLDWSLLVDYLGMEAVLLGYAVYELRFGRLAEVHESLKTHSLVIVALATAVDDVDESVVAEEVDDSPTKEDFLDDEASALDCCSDEMDATEREAAVGLADALGREESDG